MISKTKSKDLLFYQNISGYVSIGIGGGNPNTTNGGTPGGGGHPPNAPSPPSFHGACNGQSTPADVYTTSCLQSLIPSEKCFIILNLICECERLFIMMKIFNW